MNYNLNIAFKYIKENQGCAYNSLFNFLKEKKIYNLKEYIAKLICELNIYFKPIDNIFYYCDNEKYFIGKLSIQHKNNTSYILEWKFRTNKKSIIDINKIQNAKNGDLVLYKILNNNNAIIIDIIKHIENPIIGLCKLNKGKYVFLSDQKKFNMPVYILQDELNKKKIRNYKVSIKNILKYNKHYTAEIDKIICSKYDNFIDEKIAINRFNILDSFKKNYEKEIEKITNQKLENDRTDLTNNYFITIDGKYAKDLDDAFYIEKNSNHYKLIVSIADVSHYVLDQSELDKEAMLRSNSVYLLKKVIPMLPEELSNNLCSLNPGVKKLALSCEMIFNIEGELLNYKFYNSIILSREKLIYEDVNDYFNNKQYKNIHNKKILDVAYELYKKIQNQFMKYGYLDFNIFETKIDLNKNNFPIDIKLKKQNKSEKLIEFFMLSANRCASLYLKQNNLEGIHRTHDPVNSERIDESLKFINKLNPDLNLDYCEKVTNKYIQNLLLFLNKKGSDDFIDEKKYISKILLLRSMEKAKYSYNNKGHFAIGVDNYTHFTSPIRRYADLYVHRIIKNSLSKINSQSNVDVNLMCAILNNNEFLAQKCEQFLYSIKKAKYLDKNKKNYFYAMISDISKFGIIVMLKNFIEGIIPFKLLTDDYYIYDDKNKTIIGQNNNKIFSIGMKLKIKTYYINIYSGSIQFQLYTPNKRKN